MALTLRYQGETQIPVEIEGLTPDFARGQSVAELEQMQIFHGNQKLPLAEFFDLSGDAADGRLDFEGNLSGVHWIGAHMTEGEIHIHGDAGRHIGSEMRGGSIIVEGNASDWVGGEMHGGLIHVQGNAGHLIGAAYRGSPRGMTRGTILIDGDVGNEIGHTMRRGMLAVGGRCGDMPAFNMIAGNVYIFGDSGIRPGAGMRRGTIGLFGAEAPSMLPSFRSAGRARPLFMQLVLRQLKDANFPVPEDLFAGEFEQFHGDFLEGGRGEILTRVAA